MKRRLLPAVAVTALIALTGACSSVEVSPDPTPVESVEITAEPSEDALTKEERIAAAEDTQAIPQPEATQEPSVEPALDLTTDEGLCVADAELTNLELNDALAPTLGFPSERDLRSFDQDEAIRAHKNDAFSRACPERMS